MRLPPPFLRAEWRWPFRRVREAGQSLRTKGHRSLHGAESHALAQPHRGCRNTEAPDLAHRESGVSQLQIPVCAVSTVSQFLGTCYVPGEALGIQYLISSSQPSHRKIRYCLIFQIGKLSQGTAQLTAQLVRSGAAA